MNQTTRIILGYKANLKKLVLGLLYPVSSEEHNWKGGKSLLGFTVTCFQFQSAIKDGDQS